MSGNIRKIILFAIVVCVTIILTGCQDPWITDTKRNAIEQYMLATVIERITEKADFKPYAKKKVYMDYTYLAPQTDKEYVQGRLEMELARKRCVVVGKREEADTRWPPPQTHRPPLPLPVPLWPASHLT